MSYGSFPSSDAGGAHQRAFFVPSQHGRRRRMAAGVAAASLLAAAALVCAALTLQQPGGGRAELSVYKDKYDDVHQEGGSWMQCMRCRHESKHCHPSKRERAGMVPKRTNACPPHAGMTTVAVKRRGEVGIEWVSKSWLMPPSGNGTNATNATEGEEAETPEGAGEGAENATVMCVKPPPGYRNRWGGEEDCMPVMDWLKTLDYSAGYGVGDKAEPPPEEEREKMEMAGCEDPEEGEEGADDGKSPFQKWYEEKVNKVYRPSYCDQGEDAEDGKDKPQEGEGEGGENKTAVDLESQPPSPEDCYGPPSFECSVSCLSSCLSAPSIPSTLSAARTQQLSLDYDMPMDVGNDAGYVENMDQFQPPIVVPGGNRDMFGINNQYDTVRRVAVWPVSEVAREH